MLIGQSIKAAQLDRFQRLRFHFFSLLYVLKTLFTSYFYIGPLCATQFQKDTHPSHRVTMRIEPIAIGLDEWHRGRINFGIWKPHHSVSLSFFSVSKFSLRHFLWRDLLKYYINAVRISKSIKAGFRCVCFEMGGGGRVEFRISVLFIIVLKLLGFIKCIKIYLYIGPCFLRHLKSYRIVSSTLDLASDHRSRFGQYHLIELNTKSRECTVWRKERKCTFT